MDDILRQELEKNGADVEGTLDRFLGEEEMYVKFLKKTIDSPDFQSLSESIEQKDYKGAFRLAHALKGVTGNLGLIPIENLASDITELLRGKELEEIDEQAVLNKKQEMQEAYHLFRNIISES